MSNYADPTTDHALKLYFRGLPEDEIRKTLLAAGIRTAEIEKAMKEVKAQIEWKERKGDQK